MISLLYLLHRYPRKIDNRPSMYLMVDPSRKHFLAKGNNINPIAKIEVFVHPHLSWEEK